MPRVKRGVIARARHKKVLDAAKGYRGRRKNVYRIAKQAVMRPDNMPTVTVDKGSVSSALCGSHVSMRGRVNSA